MEAKPAPTSPNIYAALHRHHKPDKWLTWTELNTGTGTRGGNFIDFYALAQFPSDSYQRIAYEIKVSRGDFLREIANPLKRKQALCWSNRYYFVTPPGLVKPTEIPPECGLMEIINRRPRWGGSLDLETALDVKVPAPWRDTPPPSWALLASMVRSYREGKA